MSSTSPAAINTIAPDAPLRTPELFLPDLCGIRAVFVVVVAAELLAIVLTLAPGGLVEGRWQTLALTSLFIQWVALSSISVLCLGRRPLARLGNVRAAAVSYGLILLITAVIAELAWLIFLPAIRASVLNHWVFDSARDGASSLRALNAAGFDHQGFLLSSIGISAIVAAVVLRYFYVQNQWKARVESENEARIQALQSRIRPHFLFNSMNTIASLARSAPELAEQVTEDLASLFRVSLGDARVPTTVVQEMELCRQYLRIETLRLGDRLSVRFDEYELPGDALLPALTIQPLVENAIYHGVEPAPDGGDIVIQVRFDRDRFRIVVENSRPGKGASLGRAGNRMALDNVRQRLGAFFAGDCNVTLADSPERFRVEVSFPYRSEVE